MPLKTTFFPKYNKTSQKKIDFLFPNATVKNKTKEEKDKDVKEKVKETVIKNISQSVIDDQVLVNATVTAINRTDNLTYVEADITLNQSSIQNSERFGVEEIEKDVNISESNLSAAGITGITLGTYICFS